MSAKHFCSTGFYADLAGCNRGFIERLHVRYTRGVSLRFRTVNLELCPVGGSSPKRVCGAPGATSKVCNIPRRGRMRNMAVWFLALGIAVAPAIAADGPGNGNDNGKPAANISSDWHHAAIVEFPNDQTIRGRKDRIHATRID